MDKKCSKCKEVKSLNEFHKDKLNKDGCQNTCKECRKQYQKKYQSQYRQDNKAKFNEYLKNKRKNDIAFALRCNVSSTVSMALNRSAGSKNGESVMKYLPYTIEQLKEHLENQFVEGMTWNNRSEWHIDHIIPQSVLLDGVYSMDHPNFQKCWALENLQPLWAKENLSKGNKIL